MEVSDPVRPPLDPAGANGPRLAACARDSYVLAFLGLALALALLRFVSLSSWSLWLDEALTLADVQGGGEVNPVGYRVFGWFYALSEGRPGEGWLRAPAAFFGLASIAATFWAFLPFLGARAAALAAFLVAASAWHLYWSQNARFYTLAQTLALLGGGALLRGLFRGSTRRAALGLMALALAALTHPSAVFLAGPLLGVPWIARWLDWVPPEAARSRAWSLLGAAGLFVLLLGSGWALRAWLVWEARQGVGSPLHFGKTVGYLVTPTLGLAFLIGAARKLRAPATFTPVLVTLLAFTGAALASLFVRVSAQYVFVLLPWLAACAALTLVPRPGVPDVLATRVRSGVLTLLVALPGLVESGLYFALRRGDRPRWREAYAYVFEHRAPDDLVFGMDAPVAEYYLAPQARRLRDWTAVTWLDDWRARLPLEWRRYDRRTWFVVNATQLDDWTSLQGSREARVEFERLLREECERVASFEVPLTPRDLDVHVYVTREPGAEPP
jgi:hypothetical protein